MKYLILAIIIILIYNFLAESKQNELKKQSRPETHLAGQKKM